MFILPNTGHRFVSQALNVQKSQFIRKGCQSEVHGSTTAGPCPLFSMGEEIYTRTVVQDQPVKSAHTVYQFLSSLRKEKIVLLSKSKLNKVTQEAYHMKRQREGLAL